MGFKAFKEGKYVIFQDLDTEIIYSGTESDVKVIPLDTEFDSVSVTGTTPTLSSPLIFTNGVFQKNGVAYKKQEYIKFLTESTGFKTATGGSVVVQDEGFSKAFLLGGM